MNQLILAAVLLIGLVLIPFGLPGTWIIAAGALGYQLPRAGLDLDVHGRRRDRARADR